MEGIFFARIMEKKLLILLAGKREVDPLRLATVQFAAHLNSISFEKSHPAQLSDPKLWINTSKRHRTPTAKFEMLNQHMKKSTEYLRMKLNNTEKGM